jgi:uncharacterized protein
MNRRAFLRHGLLTAAAIGTRTSAAAASAAPARVIDAHCHAGHGLNHGKTDKNYPAWTTYNDPEWTLRRMAEVGIDRTVIFPISNVTYEAANEEIAAYVKRWPDKFIGFAKHDAKTEAGRIRELLQREVGTLGLKGLKLHGVPTAEMAEAAAELRIPILFHPPGVAESLAIVRAHPRVSFILAHLGSFGSRSGDEHDRAIDAARDLPNLHLETSSVVFVNYLERAAREVPPERLIFGSDGPLVDSRVELHKIRLLGLAPEHESLVLGGNIRRLLGLN